jgi:hypothetical protein
MDCRVLTTGVLDHERETSLDDVLATLELPARRFQAELGTGRAAELLASAAYGSTAARVKAFVEQGGGCRATFFNYRRKLGGGNGTVPS